MSGSNPGRRVSAEWHSHGLQHCQDHRTEGPHHDGDLRQSLARRHIRGHLQPGYWPYLCPVLRNEMDASDLHDASAGRALHKILHYM